MLALFIPWFQLKTLFTIPIPIKGLGDRFANGLPIEPFGLLVFTGVILGFRLAEYRAEKEGVPADRVAELATWSVFPGFIGGHVFDVVFYHPERIAEDPMVLLRIWDGLSSIGGFLAAIAGALFWCWRRKKSFFETGDPIVWAFPLGWMFGRTGCFVVHDHPGAVTDFPLAVAGYQVGDAPYLPRHDLGLYEVLWSIAVMLLFLWLGKKKRAPGFYMGMFTVLYGPFRFGLDFLRASADDIGSLNADTRYFGLTPGHYGSLALTAAGIAILVYIHRKPAQSAPPPGDSTTDEKTAPP